VHRRTSGQRRKETQKLKKSEVISGTSFAVVKRIPSIVGVVVLASVIMAVGLALVGVGYLFRARRRQLEKKKETPLDWYTLPGRVDFSSESQAQRRPLVTRSKNDV